jgi:hypothetical protein
VAVKILSGRCSGQSREDVFICLLILKDFIF